MAQALVTVGATLAFLFAVQFLARTSTSALGGRFGWGAVPWTTGWLGVPVHELAHVIACLLTGRKLRAISLFAPNPVAGTLGSVAYEPGRGPFAWIAGFVIGVAPLAGGTALLWGLAWLAGLAGPGTSPSLAEVPALLRPLAAVVLARADGAADGAFALWQGDAWSKAALFAALATSASVAVHLVPSRADLAGAWRGGLLLLGVGAAVVAGLHWRGYPAVAAVVDGAVKASLYVAPGLAYAACLLVALRLVVAVAGAVLPGSAVAAPAKPAKSPAKPTAARPSAKPAAAARA